VLHDAITIPKAAVNRGQDSTFAYVIGADRKVSVRPITVAALQDASAIITSGLKVGESVVTDGQMSLRPGSSVLVREPPSSEATSASAGGERPSTS
jgi:multidrug efflux system membrane fusion protein